MQLTDADWWRDGIALAIIDDVNREGIVDAVLMSETGEEFNWAIWAAGRFEDVVRAHYGYS